MARKASRSLSDGACDAINKVDLHESFVAELLLQGVSDAGCSDVHAKVYHEHCASVLSQSADGGAQRRPRKALRYA